MYLALRIEYETSSVLMIEIGFMNMKRFTYILNVICGSELK